MFYGNVSVASIAVGALRTQTIKALAQAEEYDGHSVILLAAGAEGEEASLASLAEKSNVSIHARHYHSHHPHQ